ncbi:hypothetical protein PoB_000470700 [Plakobranchus ocellatus]|uniref:Uncharacterized protein n=1 Tax=Plakobranchus ocellatus TaxID=259542 RepID=A0AAV3Y7W1_9GAST|nr:hypothetical protein PoB_000470700 [Plakobranchus ocellatus]
MARRSDERVKFDSCGVRKPIYLHSREGLFRLDIALVSWDLAESTRREILRDVGSNCLPVLITITSYTQAKNRINSLDELPQGQLYNYRNTGSGPKECFHIDFLPEWYYTPLDKVCPASFHPYG